MRHKAELLSYFHIIALTEPPLTQFSCLRKYVVVLARLKKHGPSPIPLPSSFSLPFSLSLRPSLPRTQQAMAKQKAKPLKAKPAFNLGLIVEASVLQSPEHVCVISFHWHFSFN